MENVEVVADMFTDVDCWIVLPKIAKIMDIVDVIFYVHKKEDFSGKCFFYPPLRDYGVKLEFEQGEVIDTETLCNRNSEGNRLLITYYNINKHNTNPVNDNISVKVTLGEEKE